MIVAFLLMLATTSASDTSESSPCTAILQTYQGRNSIELARGYAACTEEGRVDDAAFLGMLSRIRFGTDFVLLPPSDLLALMEQADFQVAAESSNKYIDEKLARDPERFASLVERVRAAELSVPADYQPGWIIRGDGKRALYGEVINGWREDTLAMESYVAMLVRDDAYFAAYEERITILDSLKSKEISELPDRFGKLSKIQRERMDVIGDPPSNTAVPWRKVYEPGPDASFTELHRAFNGPTRGETLLFRSLEDLRKSWVALALTDEELSSLASRVDFESEVIGVYAVGGMPNATENLFVTQFAPDEDGWGHSISVVVGVAGEHCNFGPSPSYPFILVKTKSRNTAEIGSSSRQNYPDQCSPVMSGSPVQVPGVD